MGGNKGRNKIGDIFDRAVGIAAYPVKWVYSLYKVSLSIVGVRGGANGAPLTIVQYGGSGNRFVAVRERGDGEY